MMNRRVDSATAGSTGAALLAALALAVPARALEPRFDHRDEDGIFAEVGVSRDTVSADGLSDTRYAPVLRLAYGADLIGYGSEFALGASLRLGSAAGARNILYAADLRYRGYFGTEELKTFFDVGVWVPFSTRWAIGPRVGLGAIYDFGRSLGLYLSFGFGTGFGPMRVVVLDAAAGLHWRWL
jgi:hypothetical protein